MKIDLDSMTVFAIAERFARDIYTHVLGRRLARVGTRINSDYTPIPDIRRAVASIECPWERGDFINSVRFHFRKILKEHASPARWQDYVAMVRSAEARRAA
jgi:hypothetical protein